MSELTAKSYKIDLRLNLMNTACALALLACSAGTNDARAEDTDRPTVWLELGGQLERVGGTGDRFTAPFMTITPTPEPYKFASPLDAVRPPRYATGGFGKISFEPAGSNWVFAASVRYGRSNGNKTSKHQTSNPEKVCIYAGYCNPRSYTAANFVKTFAKHKESHAILDFTVGKDVGLGIFGKHGSAIVNAGVRYAQFQASSDVRISARPVVHEYNGFPYTSGGYPYVPGMSFNEYKLMGHSSRSFHGIGPSISMSASTPLLGNSETAEFDLDLGANAAVLFGRQRADLSHQTTASQYHGIFFLLTPSYTSLYHHHNTVHRIRSVVVPNVGGFAAVSLKFPNAKVSFGYRGDFFFGAMDTGIDARKTATTDFHGPYATISIGLGG